MKFVIAVLLAVCAATAAGQATKSYTFDPQLNEVLIRVADMAYCCEKNLVPWNCGPLCDQLASTVQYEDYFEVGIDGDEIAFVSARSDQNKHIYISFRGTNTIYQLLLEGLQEKNEGYSYHDIEKACVQSVFFDRYKLVKDAIFTEVKRLLKAYPGYTLALTGHSLGATLSTHAAMDLVLSGVVSSDKVLNYAYASPRVGNYAFASKYNDVVPNTFRIVHWNDIFVTWPVSCDKNDDGDCQPGTNDPDYGTPGGKFFGWHTNTQVFYNKDMTSYEICAPESQSCADQWHSIFFRSIGAHLRYMGVGMGCGTMEIPAFGIHGEKQSDCVHLPTNPFVQMMSKLHPQE